MHLINAVIIDDELHVREGLKEILNTFCGNVNVLGLAGNIKDGKKLIDVAKPDLVFLDVQLTGKTSFDLLKEIPVIDFDIIFITSFDRYALRAIKYSALDYLLKPVNTDELKLAVSKYDKNRTEQISVLLDNLESADLPKKIVIKHSGGVKFIFDNQIIRCEAHSNYSQVFFTDGSKLMVAKTLKEFEELLPEKPFLRVHQSHLINLTFVREYMGGRGGEIQLISGETIPVSRSRKQSVLDFLLE